VASHRITSFSTLDDEAWFAIAYYDVAPDDRLHELHVRTYDRRAEHWRSVTLSAPIGSVLSVQRNGRLFYVEGHSSPSATPLLVCDEVLKRSQRLHGWPMLMLPDGRVVFHRSMVHFAPAHSGILAIYDPRTNREDSFYPAGAGRDRMPEVVRGTGEWID